MSHKKARLIAFYLPQFHPIPENDEWWGKGFTEWTNVAKAKPLFKGHYQPHVPADLGFYDLRVHETRAAQAEMAQKYGIEGFCYWHYWFAGKRLIEKPFEEVLKSGKPDFPFCLAWANATWTGIWHGSPHRILIKQEYPGMKDYESHFYALLDAFIDPRYITIDDKPVFVFFHPHELPEPNRFTDFWRELAMKSGLKGLYFIGIADQSWLPEKYGFDASILDSFSSVLSILNGFSRSYIDKIFKKLTKRDLKQLYKEILSRPTVYLYRDAIKHALPTLETTFEQYPCVIPNWDNTPRSGSSGVVFHNSTPELFRIHVKKAIEQVAHKKPERRVIFIKSWNEWAEGNYLEPDQQFGRGYLEVLKNEVLGTRPSKC